MDSKYIQNNKSCYENVVSQRLLWDPKDPPLRTPLPILMLQIGVCVGSNLFFLVLLRNHHQPRVVRELLSALVVSPFIMEIFSVSLSEAIWPRQGNSNLRVIANFGIIYAMFIKGLQMDLSPLTNRRGNKTLFLSFGIILIPFFIGCALYNLFSADELNGTKERTPYVYWGAVMASSSFPTLASILARLKLLSTDIGRESLCICMINDLVSWGLMVIVISLSTFPHADLSCEIKSWEPVICVFVSTILFAFFCFYAIRPCIVFYLEKHHGDGELYEDSFVTFMVILVMSCGLVAEFFGGFAFVGAFSLGLAIPRGPFVQTLLEKMEDCVSGVLMPVYFASVGVKCRGISIDSWIRHFYISVAAAILKPLCVFLFSVLCSMPIRDAFSIAVLHNVKGLLSVSIASIGFQRRQITREAFVVLVFIILLSTATVGPIMALFHKMVIKNNRNYKRKSISLLRPDDDFRVVACIQETQNLPGLLNLLEITSNSERSPMSVFGVHLLELIGRESAMLIVHQASGEEEDMTSSSSSSSNDNHFFSKDSAQWNQIVSAFDDFRRKHIGTTVVQTLNVVSPMESMHIDIANIAVDKQVSMIMLPYHRHQGMDGKLEDGSNVEFRTVNKNVMRTAPCSVGLLINRSNEMFHIARKRSRGSASEGNDVVSVAMLYFGGPDDREALSYVLRLARHPLVRFALIRFVSGDDPADVQPKTGFADEDREEDGFDDDVESVYTESEVEKLTDNDVIDGLLRRSRDGESVDYAEIRSNNGEETVAKLRGMDHDRFDLYVVGRGDRVYSPMTAGLADWSENPELGVIGDVLVTSEFMADASVLVIQQYLDGRKSGDAGFSHLD